MQQQIARRSKNRIEAIDATEKIGLEKSQLMKLFVDELKCLYWAEVALTLAIPKLITKTSSHPLNAALKNYLLQTEKHITRLIKIFNSFGRNAGAKKCEAMEGLIKKILTIMEEYEPFSIFDIAIISAIIKVENYEMSTYTTLGQFAEILGLTSAAKILGQTSQEEKTTSTELSQVAMQILNIKTADEIY